MHANSNMCGNSATHARAALAANIGDLLKGVKQKMNYNSAKIGQLAIVRPRYLVGYINNRIKTADSTLPAQTVRNVLMLLYCYYGYMAGRVYPTPLLRRYPVLYHGVYYPTLGGVGDLKLDHDGLDNSTLSQCSYSARDLLTLGVNNKMTKSERVELVRAISCGLSAICEPCGANINKITNRVTGIVQSLPYWARSIWWSTDTDGTVRKYIMDNNRLVDEVSSKLIK